MAKTKFTQANGTFKDGIFTPAAPSLAEGERSDMCCKHCYDEGRQSVYREIAETSPPLCENCEVVPATQETDDSVRLCETCYQEAAEAMKSPCLSCGKEFVPPLIADFYDGWTFLSTLRTRRAVNEFAEAFHQSQIMCEECR